MLQWTGLGCDCCGFGTVENVDEFNPNKPCPECGSVMNEKLIRQYVRLIIEDDGGYGGDFGGGYGGGTWAGSTGLYGPSIVRGVIEPFKDAAKVGSQGLKKVAAATAGSLSIILKGLMQIVMSDYDADFNSVFQRMNEKINALNNDQGFRQAMQRVDKAFENEDLAVVMFMTAPGYFLGRSVASHGVNFALSIALPVLNVLGIEDKAREIKNKVSSALSTKNKSGLKEALDDAIKIINNDPTANSWSKATLGYSDQALKDIIKLHAAIMGAKTLDQMSKKMASAPELKHIKGLAKNEQGEAEHVVLDKIKERVNNWTLNTLRDQLKTVKRSLGADSPLVEKYREVIATLERAKFTKGG